MYGKNQDRKKAKETLKAKLQQSVVDGEITLQLSDKEWEVMAKSQENETWKDEYALLIATSPILLVFLGVFWGAFTGDMTLLTATTSSLGMLKTQLGINMGELAWFGILTGLGLKTVKGLR